MKTLLLSIVLLLAAFAIPAQTNNPANSTLLGGLTSFLNPADTNGLMNANELNASFGYVHDSDRSLSGGTFKLDYWVTDQQGAMFEYQEFSDRSAYWQLGYQVRTVFKRAELSVATGTRQNTDDSFGDVMLFVKPQLTVRLINTPNWDVRAWAATDFIAGTSKPNPSAGFTFRFLKL